MGQNSERRLAKKKTSPDLPLLTLFHDTGRVPLSGPGTHQSPFEEAFELEVEHGKSPETLPKEFCSIDSVLPACLQRLKKRLHGGSFVAVVLLFFVFLFRLTHDVVVEYDEKEYENTSYVHKNS